MPDETSRAAGAPPRERTPAEYFEIGWRRRWFLAAFAVVFAAAGAGVRFLIPRKYTAVSIVAPPSQSSSGGQFAKLAGGASDLAALAGILVEGESAKFYSDILGSREILEAVAKRTNLAEHYGVHSLYLAGIKLGKCARHTVTKGSLIETSVSDRSPQKAAEVAAAFPEELNALLRRIRSTQASTEKEFLTSRLAAVRADLDRAEMALREFEERHGVLSVPDSVRVLMDVYAKLKTELALRETDLRVLMEFRTANDPEVLAAQKAVESLRRQLAELDEPRTMAPAAAGAGPSFAPGEALVPVREMPAVALQYARLLRDVKVQEGLYQFLTMQLEGARIQEAKDTPVCRIVQLARPPEKPSDHGYGMSIALGALAGLALGFLWILSREG